MTEVLTGLGSGERAQIAALRAQGSFFWLDVSLTETTPEELSEALAVSPGALRALPGSGDELGSRTVDAEGGFVAFTLRCYFDVEAPIEVRVVVTSDYLLTLLDLQINERAYQVSVVATIFVPLTFVTGFFGMNFGWMVDHIDGPIAFWLLGMGIPIATAGLAWRVLLRRFLLGEDRSTRRR